jgi:ATP-dependent helicase/nuclease subunit A
MPNRLQQLASNPKNSSWVFASAGSGKTKILTDRVLRLLLSDILPSKILCLTFTKAAAREMEKRINDTLSSWIICSDEDLKNKLEQLNGKVPSSQDITKARILFIKILDCDSKIKVQTIHSFCQSLIKIFPFEAKVKPNFELLDENGEKLLLKEAQQLMRKMAEQNIEVRNLITEVSAKLHDESLADLISNLLSKKEKLVFLKEEFFGSSGIIDEIFKKFDVSKNDDEQKIFADFLAKIDQKEVSNFATILTENGLKTNLDLAAKIKSFLSQPTLQNFPIYKSVFLTKENTQRKIPGKIPADILSIATEQCELILQFSDRINSLKIAHDSALILKFCDVILQNYSNLKKEKALLDYNDLIIETSHLLSNPQHRDFVKMKMDSGFDHILIDESQDTNHRQWEIIKALSEDFFSGLSASEKERSVFVVGDEKQSIFSFQGADINLGREVFSHFKNKLGDNLQEIALDTSFRSTAEILDAVDLVFADAGRQNATTKLGKFNQHKTVRDGSGHIEIWPQIKIEKEKSTEKNYEWQLHFLEENEKKEAALMAETIAIKIKSWINNSRQIAAKNRAVNYGDIMILLRNRTGIFLHELIKNFHQYQIPFNSISKLKFSESLLIQDLIAAAKFTLLKDDDLNLACLLKSPFFLLSEEELLEICLRKNQNKTSLYEAITDTNLKNSLDEFSEKSHQLNCFEFFYFLLRTQNYYENFIAYFGQEALQILDKFLETAADFNKNFSPNLQQFLEFIEKIDPEISLSETQNNSVKITTVHSSKGLQAPIIIMPDCSYNLRKLPSNKNGIFWIEGLPIWCSRKANENKIIADFREKRFIETSEEYLRLLYVAMTRAEDELYIGGFGNDSTYDCWYEIIKSSLTEKMISEDDFRKEKVALPNKLQSENQFIKSAEKPLKQKIEEQKTPINKSLIKGKIIHKILEVFGKNYREEKIWLKNLAKNIIEKEEIITAEEKNEIASLTNKFLDSKLFTEIFCGEVKCEFETVTSGNLQRIDLLIAKENEVIIIDYKSDETLPKETPQDYITQLQNYKKIISKLYPKKTISCAILWIKFMELTLIELN